MMSRPRKRSLFSPEDLKLWQSIARSATPLPGHTLLDDAAIEALIAGETDPVADLVSRETLTARPAKPTSSSERTPVVLRDDFQIGSLGPSAPAPAAGMPNIKGKRQLPHLAHGYSPGVDHRTAQRFKRGRMDIDARIDLHGMGQEVAHSALIRFISGSASAGLRCVLVITGQGDRGQGVLKRMVPRWLNDETLRPIVLSFSQAQVEHGGYGALYVLLRRNR
ncbi:Smr/MutS family protein [Novispirillum itersonii]|uniref:Smr/MutS family protein n=1 Tax=Novispirillum itersonii TaxID=189 RepID=UPI000373101A|nr:Smr/MutS family protein [Novispirillum itersonii]